MRLAERIYLVGSGSFGFDLTDPYDCHVYLLDGGTELALIDVGAGMGAEAIVGNVRRDGFDPGRIRHLVLTHGHGDHAGGVARMGRLLGRPRVYLHRDVADFLRRGDERGVSLDLAKQAGIYPAEYRLEPCEVDVSPTATRSRSESSSFGPSRRRGTATGTSRSCSSRRASRRSSPGTPSSSGERSSSRRSTTAGSMRRYERSVGCGSCR